MLTPWPNEQQCYRNKQRVSAVANEPRDTLCYGNRLQTRVSSHNGSHCDKFAIDELNWQHLRQSTCRGEKRTNQSAWFKRWEQFPQEPLLIIGLMDGARFYAPLDIYVVSVYPQVAMMMCWKTAETLLPFWQHRIVASNNSICRANVRDGMRVL